MKDYMQRGKKFTLFIMVALALFTLIGPTYGVLAEPGSEEDPVLTLSYIEQIFMPKVLESFENKISELKTSIEAVKSSLSQIEGRISSVEKQSKSQFEVVNIKSGQKFIGSAGTEVILRMGKATIIASDRGGLSDVTEGRDLRQGEDMPANHLLIIPLSDGRGFNATKDVIIMVKGGYEVK